MFFSGYGVDYLGSIEVGSVADVSLIDAAITDVLKRQDNPISIVMATADMGVQTIVKDSSKVSLIILFIFDVFHMIIF